MQLKLNGRTRNHIQSSSLIDPNHVLDAITLSTRRDQQAIFFVGKAATGFDVSCSIEELDSNLSQDGNIMSRLHEYACSYIANSHIRHEWTSILLRRC
jgi:hypothetical protein